MKHEDDEEIDRRPGQIEQRMNAHAGDELPERVEIAQELAARAAADSAVEDRHHDATREQAIEPDACARQHAARAPRRDPRAPLNAISSASVSMTSVTTLALEITRS